MTATSDDRTENVIEIRELTKDYEVGFLKKKRVRALDRLSLDVKRGEIFGFLGPNGAGKTTTLKLLMGLIFPTLGTAKILGQSIESVRTRARIGYLPENPYFYDYLTGRELLDYTSSLFDVPKPEARERTARLLAAVGLEDARADRQLRKYSKGMLQRIGIAQALAGDPEIVFMDEPMSGLDPIGRREVRDLILSLRAQGKTIFFSSHILSDVEALCDRAAILSRGRLIRIGTVEELTGQAGAELEIIAIGMDRKAIDTLPRESPFIESAKATPNGVHLIVKDESAVEESLALIRRAGGKLVSVSPRRRSLEEVFSSTERDGDQINTGGSQQQL